MSEPIRLNHAALLRSTLTRLQDDFRWAANNRCQIECLLVESLPETATCDPLPPKYAGRKGALACSYPDFSGWVGDRATNADTDVAVRLYGGIADYRTFMRLAERGGHSLYTHRAFLAALPTVPFLRSEVSLLEINRADAWSWVFTVFGLAWHQVEGSELRVRKNPHILNHVCHGGNILELQCQRKPLPDPWPHAYSVIANLFDASAAATETLLSLQQGATAKPPQKNAVKPKFAKKYQRIIDLLNTSGPLKGEVIASKLDQSFGYVRQLCARLVRDGVLVNDDNGYRTSQMLANNN